MPTTHALDASIAIGFLIASSGNPKLAAVRASKELGYEITEAYLLTVIASDPASIDILSRQARLLTLLQSIDALRLTHVAYMSSLTDLSPRDTAQAYMSLIHNMTTLSEYIPRDEPSDITNLVRALPPRVADAVRYFLEKGDKVITPEATPSREEPSREEEERTSTEEEELAVPA